MTERQTHDEFCIHGISIVSGIRARGRAVSYLSDGRKRSGIFYVFSGEAEFIDDRNVHTVVRDGGLLFLPKGKKYRMHYTAQETLFVTVNLDTVTPSGEDVPLFSDITVLEKDDPLRRTANIMMKLEHCSASKNLGAILRRKELVYRLLLGVLRLPPFTDKEDTASRILDGVRLLEESYLESIPIEELARVSRVSENTFRSLFGKEFGMSPVKYRNHLRIERARELLSEGEFTVKEVAYACGFENIGYFCRYYKSTVGETPSETKARFSDS